jgi:uncharacterized DUF497 family protein
VILWLEWDDVNERHLAEHGIRPSEVRQTIGNRHITVPNPNAGAGRELLIGETNGGRILTISIEPTDDVGTWRPITGWSSTPEERKLFERNVR